MAIEYTSLFCMTKLDPAVLSITSNRTDDLFDLSGSCPTLALLWHGQEEHFTRGAISRVVLSVIVVRWTLALHGVRMLHPWRANAR